MDYILTFAAGVAVGALVAIIIILILRRVADRQMREAFLSLAGEALDANSRRLLEVLDASGRKLSETAAAQLEGKKALIDQSLAALAERLELVRQFVTQQEALRKQDFGQLSSSVASLSQTTGELHKMLASTQRRGVWGERMAEDVLRLAGMQENLNYVKQSAADAASGRERPDFTFILPNNLRANMDVKFPLEKYKAYLDAASDADRQRFQAELAQAVRGHIRAVASRGYIDPAVPTVNYVILFIPAEQVFSLVLQAQPDLIDEALKLRVVLASPLTLYAQLAVLRQAAENFNITRTADEVIALLGEFQKQWVKYNEELDRLGQRLEQTTAQYQAVRTTRSNMLQRPLDKIGELRESRQLPEQQ